MKVRIENPTPGGARFTSAAKARFYELQGCAKLSADGRRLHFLESHHRKRSAELSAREIADQEYRLTAGGYDGRTGILTLDEIAKIPVVRPAVLVTIPKKARSQPRRNGKVRILLQDGVPVYRAPVVSIEVGRKAGKLRETWRGRKRHKQKAHIAHSTASARNLDNPRGVSPSNFGCR